VTDLYIVRSFQEVLFGFQSAMARFCRLLPRREEVLYNFIANTVLCDAF